MSSATLSSESIQLTDEFRVLNEEKLIAIIIEGREDNNVFVMERARRAWDALITREFDRVQQLVNTFCFPGQVNVRVPTAEVDDAVQIAFIRLFNMFSNFRGTSLGEFYAALSTCVRYSCMDFCRAYMRREQKIAGRIDEVIEDEQGTERGRFDDVLGYKTTESNAARMLAREELEKIAAALSKLKNKEMRAVLEMSWAGNTIEEIAFELQITPASAYQLRSRGTKTLLALILKEEKNA